MNAYKSVAIGLAVACTILVILSVVLGFLLLQRSRFVAASDKSPFIMFDRGTAEACWSGSPDESKRQASTSENLIDKILSEGQPIKDSRGRLINNPPEIPFCKDLK